MSDLKNYTRGEGSSTSSEVTKELRKLFSTGTANDYKILSSLRARHKDENFINSVFDAYKERQEYMMRKAKKFKQLMFDRYSGRRLSGNELMRKAKKYQKKLGLNDDEFSLFYSLLHSEQSPYSDLTAMPTTKIGRTLGYSPSVLAASDKLNVSAKDSGVVQKILDMYTKTRGMHSNVVLQSLTYQDCGPEALRGDFDSKKHDRFSFVHPVVAALFLPRVNFLDEQMLISNIGYIIKCKHEGQPIMTKPDFVLYNDMIRDPNDSACSVDSAIKDIHNRYELQTRLWDQVMNLRQGKYYAPGMSNFLTAVDNCRSNVYDAPDLTYVKDEGAVLRRLLSAFSIRPTIVSTTRLWGMLGTNPHGVASGPLSMMGLGNLTTVPMVTLRLPLNITGAQSSVDIQEAMSQPQWFVENNMIVPKSQAIIHSRDVLFFYVGRRFKTINISRVNTPCNFTALPMTVAGWEALNDTIVNFDNTITVLNDLYELRSVVIVDSCKTKHKLIVGASTAIRRNNDQYLLYDPQGSGDLFESASGAGFDRNAPITEIPYNSPYTPGVGESFYKRASTRGTIWMYQKKTAGRGALTSGC